jgi:hypothetical protein
LKYLELYGKVGYGKYLFALPKRKQGGSPMSNNGTTFADLIGNIHLAEPLTIKGRKALSNLREIGLKANLSVDEFMEKIYTEPFTKIKDLTSETITFQTDPDLELPYAQRVDLNYLNLEKDKFENNLKRLTDSLFVIKGVSGSGKTTYIHHLKKEICNVEFLIINFEDTVQTIDLLGLRFDFLSRYESNVWKFISTILQIISNILRKDGGYYTGEHLKFIERIVNIYKSDIDRIGKRDGRPDDTYYVDFFEILELYIIGSIDNYEQLAQEIKNYIVDRYDKFELEEDKQHGKKEAIKLTAGLLIRLFYCLSKITTKRYACVIDNIETFVKYDEEHPIQDCDLQEIFNGIAEAIKNVRPRLPINMPGYRTFYGFVLITRETTVNIAQCYHDADHNHGQESEVDISEWFCAGDVFKNKYAYFRTKLPAIINNPYLVAFQYIIKDISPYRWGLHDLVEQMYKLNYRRMKNVISALSAVPEREIKNFTEQWKKIADLEIANPKDDRYDYLKHICRQFIVRVLIDHAQRKKYFDNIKTEKSQSTNGGTSLEESHSISAIKQGEEMISYARKVVTFLHRIAINKKHDYVSFPRLIRTLLVPRNSIHIESLASQIQDLADILYWMNEIRNEKTNWAPLITIKFDSSRVYNRDTLYEEMKCEWDTYSASLLDKSKPQKEIDSTREFGVCITEAGSFFAKITPEFEYFSCRFLFNEPALLALRNLEPVMINKKRTFRGVAIIERIRERAFCCINGVIEGDGKTFAFTGSEKSSTNTYASLYKTSEIYNWAYQENLQERVIVHPLRVFHQHMGYIYHYIEYIKNDVDSWLNLKDKEEIIRLLKEELEKYWIQLDTVTKNHPQYFDQYKAVREIWGL